MKTAMAVLCILIAICLTNCRVTGPSVKVKTPKVKLPGVELGAQTGAKVCLPGQGKKGRC